ncbi:hypothetical protein [Tissierella praeacuta]|uniref:hypothetical protein n=1 Tax=Tissierella praeacuta TaxID=43131 RepID=UPI003342C84B
MENFRNSRIVQVFLNIINILTILSFILLVLSLLFVNKFESLHITSILRKIGYFIFRPYLITLWLWTFLFNLFLLNKNGVNRFIFMLSTFIVIILISVVTFANAPYIKGISDLPYILKMILKAFFLF